jgi:hypothetical protein
MLITTAINPMLQICNFAMQVDGYLCTMKFKSNAAILFCPLFGGTLSVEEN